MLIKSAESLERMEKVNTGMMVAYILASVLVSVATLFGALWAIRSIIALHRFPAMARTSGWNDRGRQLKRRYKR